MIRKEIVRKYCDFFFQFSVEWKGGNPIFHISACLFCSPLKQFTDRQTEFFTFTHCRYNIQSCMSKNNCSSCFTNLCREIDSEKEVGVKQLGFQWWKWSLCSLWKRKFFNYSIAHYHHCKSTQADYKHPQCWKYLQWRYASENSMQLPHLSIKGFT